MMPPAFLSPMAGLALGATAGWVFSRIGTPVPWMLGPLVLFAVLRVAGARILAVPGGRHAGQCLLGCPLGARFEPDFLRGEPRFVGAVGVTVVGAIAASAAFGWSAARLSGLHPATLVLGTAPGAEMCVRAKVLQLGVPLVTAFHVTRVVVLLLCTPPLFARARAWRNYRARR